MKKRIFILTLAMVFALSSVAFAHELEKEADTEANPRASNFALGFELTDFQNDFGMGINVTSPYFIKDVMAVRAHGGFAWLDDDTEGASLYGSARLGFVASVGQVGGHARLYSEAGAIVLFPNSDFSDDIAFGGYGLFGFEFFTHPKSPVTYYLEAGGMGSSANAEKAATKPAYANGFMIEVGIRWYPY